MGLCKIVIHKAFHFCSHIDQEEWLFTFHVITYSLVTADIHTIAEYIQLLDLTPTYTKLKLIPEIPGVSNVMMIYVHDSSIVGTETDK